jgi:hypothetical protein
MTTLKEEKCSLVLKIAANTKYIEAKC